MANRPPRLTKREAKALKPRVASQPRASQAMRDAAGQQHIHCVACGKHLDPMDFDSPETATVVACAHGSQFPSCIRCVPKTTQLLAEHDRTGNPVQSANAWH